MFLRYHAVLEGACFIMQHRIYKRCICVSMDFLFYTSILIHKKLILPYHLTVSFKLHFFGLISLFM